MKQRHWMESRAVALFSGVLLTVGCDGASLQLRTAYATEVARCIANERSIVDRVGTSAEQDQTDLEAERTRCDAALATIEEAHR
jgi:hypothetical protein